MGKKVTWETVRELAGALADTEESTSYRTPAIKVGGKLIARLKEDGETIVVPMSLEERTVRMQADPDVFFVTEHYQAFPYVLVRLGKISRGGLRELLADAWQMVAR
jgi:hypothetical protein